MIRGIVVVVIMAMLFGCEKDDPKTEKDNTNDKKDNNKVIKYKTNLVIEDVNLTFKGSPEDIVVIDIDNDSHNDLILLDLKRINFFFTNNTLTVFRNSGDGKFTQIDMNSDFKKLNIHNYAVVDYNNDGYNDLVIQTKQTASVSGGEQELHFYKNSAGKTMEPDKSIKFKEEIKNFWFSDFNSDNKQDILASTDKGLLLYKCKGGTEFEPAQTLLGSKVISDVKILDVNGDKTPDISFYNFPERKYYVYANINGKLNELYSFNNVYMAAYTDLNADGHIDIALIGSGTDRGVYKQMKGKMVKIFDLPEMENGAVNWCDTDGDKIAELITSYCKGFKHYVSIYNNKSGDTFEDSKQTLFPDNDIPLKHGNDFIVVSDINSDKKDDIILSAYTTSDVKRTISAIINRYTKIE
ncbi:MAG: VCBS repeat-containing protein [Bacteroidales bacterium]|jgi:hypothetical protein|nr:VCBS repeat-containing protein [Bacteroidales bacterium]